MREWRRCSRWRRCPTAAGSDRPYVPEAELQLDGAWRDLRERLDLGHDDSV